MAENSGTSRFSPFGQYLNIKHVLTTSPPAQDHVLPGLLAGTVGMLAGPGGVGKTMFELQIALAISCGGSICGGLFELGEVGKLLKRQPGRVVMVVAEESVDVVWHRLHAIVSTLFARPVLLGIEADPVTLMQTWSENLRIYSLAGKPRVELINRDAEPTECSKYLMDACEGARLVILDPIRRFHLADENDSGAMTALVQMLQEVAANTKSALIFAHHTNRASTQMGLGDTSGAARGSTALTDGVRWQLNLSKPTRDIAKQREISYEDMGRFLMLDIAKANYLPPMQTETLERLPGGVLLLADAGQKALSSSRASRTKSKLKVVKA